MTSRPTGSNESLALEGVKSGKDFLSMMSKFFGKHKRQSRIQHADEMDNTAAEHLWIVKLIVTGDSAANHAIEKRHKHRIQGQGIDVKVGFYIHKGERKEEQCECWFELEYCDYIHDKIIDEEMFKRICENIQRGRCPHVVENSVASERTRSHVGLIHIAAGSGNKNVVKLLTKFDKRVLRSRTSCGLWPLHVAVVKSRTSVIGSLTIPPVCYFENNRYTGTVHDCDVVLAKRSPDTCKVVIQCPYIKRDGMVTNFIHMVENMHIDMIKELVPAFRGHYNYLQPVTCLLCTGKKKLAYHFIQTSRKRDSYASWYFIIYCILADSKDCLRLFLKLRHPYLKNRLQELGYTLLDIAKTFNSEQCLDMLKSSDQLTAGLHQRISPYSFLIKFAQKSDDMDSKFMERLMSSLHRQGHNINHQDDLNMTPLMYATELLNGAEVTKQLLALGADVDIKDRNGRTSMYIAITTFNSPLGANRIGGNRRALKEILFHNPDARSSSNQNALQYAAETDLGPNSYLRYLHDGCIKFQSNSVDDQDIVAQTYEERFIALSYVALLYEFGFVITSRSLLYAGGKHHLQVLSDYVARIESTPRTLQSSCRLAIRKAYPGRQLHCMIQSSQLPKRLQDYVVKPYILRYVDVEYVPDGGRKELIQI